MFVVLISKHRFWETFTTQFKYATKARDIPDARHIARDIFPMQYTSWGGEGLVAFFTGQIYEN